MSHDDFEIEPVEGLPELPPEGEEILWRGRPSTMALAREAMNLNWIIGYFAVLMAWRFLSVSDIMPLGQAIGATVPFLLLGMVVCGLLIGVSYIQARNTVYTITSARVAMRIGAALTLTLNLPYREIANASLSLRKNGTGTIALETTGKTQFSLLVLWPHADVAKILARAAEARVSIPQVARKAPKFNAVAAE